METLICKPQKRTIFVDFLTLCGDLIETRSYFIQFPKILFVYSNEHLRIELDSWVREPFFSTILPNRFCAYFEIDNQLFVPYFLNIDNSGVVCLPNNKINNSLHDKISNFWNSHFTKHTYQIENLSFNNPKNFIRHKVKSIEPLDEKINV